MPPAQPPNLPERCPNCDAAVHGPFCAQCGQETVIEVLRLKDFSHEYFQHFVTLESRLWRTLWTLVRYPGMLTTEFLAGRRRRYVRPLPLYISLSFAVFLLMSFLPQQLISLDELPKAEPGAARNALNPKRIKANDSKAFQINLTDEPDAPDKPLPEFATLEKELGLPVWSRPVVKRYYDSAQRWNANPREEIQRFTPLFQAKLPYAAFALVPLFALLTRLVYRRRRRSYAEHFLFALHLHAFAFLTLIFTLALAAKTMLTVLFWVWLVYLVLALQRFLGGRRWPQVLRAGLLLMTHNVMLGIVLLCTLVLTLPTV